MAGLAPALAAALDEIVPDFRIATVALSPCHDDHVFVTRLADHARSRTWSVPEDAPLEAVAAAVAGADCFVGVSLHGAITAFAYGRPFASLDPFGQAKLRGFAELIGWPQARSSDPAEAVRRAGRRAAGAEVAPATLPTLQARIDAHFDRVADLAAAHAGRRLAPLAWEDTPVPLHLRLRRVPRPAVPAPAVDPPNLRRPDVEASPTELRATLEDAIAARLALRREQLDDANDLPRLTQENRDLRDAMAHLEGMVHHTEREVSLREQARRQIEAEMHEALAAAARDAAIVREARGSRVFRYTRRPRALREDPERRDEA
jgi:hypothetical protein